MNIRKRGAALAVSSLVLATALGGCSIGGPTGQERADDLARQLENGGLGVHSAEAIYLTSFSGDLTVSVILEPDALQPGYSVSAETLGPILGVVARSAESMRVGGVGFYAKEEGESISRFARLRRTSASQKPSTAIHSHSPAHDSIRS
ncbi:hypothetical protein [uncultured Microbacterium sp.]|uniref:hypothetical protein n=1 Tax=uncultured Microbacterium sp. TaxID=191216 RepID=UPI0025F1EAD1|nr:hypothetical protein [uncultured Microbacterium sp.]